ncbi:MAG: (2Fe-2S)-binding protein [Geminicoccaceae bacterium]|nr:(2Fe-2S)-binding protein [Geminicoccaceae bacterium]MCX8101392.1 (2Fe-2S)-binding protein [Geminicoccaceae bacterium]
MTKAVRLELNGSPVAAVAEGGENLLALLRERLGDTSPKAGCLQGTCGACTVLLDGEPVLACLTLAELADGRRVTTVRGLQDGPRLHPLQEAFMDGFAAQCGFCTPGMLIAAKALLDREPNPTREQVIEAIAGNVCRCTGYTPIVEAILDAARRLAGRRG